MLTEEVDYVCRILDYPRERHTIGQLRYRVFVKKLRWITGNPRTQMELDRLDTEATHIGVFKGRQMVGYVRVIRGGTKRGMLLQLPAFKALLPVDLDTSPATAEISRLCVDLEAIAETEVPDILVALYRSIHDYVVVPHDVEKLYATANDRRAGYMNVRVLRNLMFTERSGPMQLVEGINTYLMELDLLVVLKNPFFRAMIGVG